MRWDAPCCYQQQSLWRKNNSSFVELGISRPLGRRGCQNIGKYWPDLTEDEVMSFWSDPKLYQKLTPNPDAVKVINELAAQGCNIIFLSMCKKGHFASKVQSSKEWFNIPPEQYGFLVTHEKHFADVDIIIDDRNRFLEAFKNKPEVIKIKIATPYSQDVDLSISLDLETNDWNKIGQFINELGE